MGVSTPAATTVSAVFRAVSLTCAVTIAVFVVITAVLISIVKVPAVYDAVFYGADRAVGIPYSVVSGIRIRGG